MEPSLPRRLSWKHINEVASGRHLNIVLSKMKAFALLVIIFTCLGRPSLAKEGNYNEAEQTLPRQEWLDPWDMIHYDATVQSLDKTVSFVAYLTKYRFPCRLQAESFFVERTNRLDCYAFLSRIANWYFFCSFQTFMEDYWPLFEPEGKPEVMDVTLNGVSRFLARWGKIFDGNNIAIEMKEN